VTFEEYVLVRGGSLVRFARLLTGDEHRAEDLVQDVLAKAYVHWRRVGGLDRPDLYVRRMLVNAHHSWRRRRANREVAVAAVQILERVPFDEARRCAMPFRLGDLPAGTRLAECTLELTHSPPGPYMTWESTLTLVEGDRRLSLCTRDDPLGPDPALVPGRLRARPYRVWAERGGSWVVRDEGVHIQVSVRIEDDPFTQAEVLGILAGLRVTGHPQDPRTW
jgi:hypothetical protein